jgi:hypothetical protein
MIQFVTLVIVGLAPSVTAGRYHGVVYRLILPDGYVGWVRIDFSVKSAIELDASDDNIATVVVPESGIAQTSSTYVSGARESYLLFYKIDDRLAPVPKSQYSTGFMLGGFSQTQQSTSGEPEALSWYFLIGPKSLRNQNPAKLFLRRDTPPPTPGRIKSAPITRCGEGDRRNVPKRATQL